ncbi:MAG: DUF6147 family protein [Lachnospiraceae bacterium]
MKKVLVLCMSVVVLIGMSTIPVKAEEQSVKVEESYLLRDVTQVTSERVIQPRGAFLQQGSSSLVKTGEGLVTAGGDTIAQQVVKSISVNVILERLDENDMRWVQQHSWIAEGKNTTMIQCNKTVPVPRDQFYRVRSIHYAETDTSSSFTDGLFIK